MENKPSPKMKAKPPSTKLPMSPQHRPIKQNQNALLAADQYYDNQDFETSWLSEFLSYEKTRNESIAKADLLNFTKLPGSTVHPHADKHLLRQSKNAKNQVAKPKSSMSADERWRLKELSRQLNKNKPAIGRQQRLTPYVEANTKISRVLQHVKLKNNREDMEASQLNDFFELVARETRAATRIQTQCRRVLATRHSKQVKLEVRSATQIQSSVRMLLAKILLGQFKEREKRATEVRNRFVRLRIARYRRRKRIALEKKCAIISQSVARMFLAKCLLHKMRLQHSFEINQQRWRALSIRLAWKDLRLNFSARQIQCIVRRKLATTRVRKLSTLFTKSAITIQCVWRRFAAKILKLDTDYRATVDKMKNKIRIISSAKGYWRQQVEELAKPNKLQQLNTLEAQKKKLEAERDEKEDQIRTLNSHYKDQLELQDQIISPRAIATGWEEQLKINLNDTRERITSAKLHLLFNIQIKLKKVICELERLYAIRSEAKGSLDHWSNWHQIEQDRLWDYQRQHNREVEEKEFRHAVVDEKLRWAVKHCVYSGKPDKRRSLANGPVENAVVERLIDTISTRADEIQAVNHAEHTFKPLQKFWDSLSEAAIEFSSVAPSNFSHKKGAGFKDHAAKVPAAASYDSSIPDIASLYSQKQTFPSKLPFGLVQKVRDERETITASLKPK